MLVGSSAKGTLVAVSDSVLPPHNDRNDIALRKVLARGKVLSLRDICDQYDVPHSTVMRWIKVGVGGKKLAAQRLGKKWYTTDQALRQWVRLTNKE